MYPHAVLQYFIMPPEVMYPEPAGVLTNSPPQKLCLNTTEEEKPKFGVVQIVTK